MLFKIPPRPPFATYDSVKTCQLPDILCQYGDPFVGQDPDKAPCDFYLWGICEAEIRTVKPKTLEDLIKVVNEFVASLDAAEVRRAVTAVRPRAELCIKMGGGLFESKLQKYKRGTIEEL